ncbi:MAG: T9SS type A sorting domain-containing protein [Candidatus Cloacimonetes bacterium]|nr:T9SS type A sorting domain-containing protein [Candidatus Cloacimonadota bacterium]
MKTKVTLFVSLLVMLQIPTILIGEEIRSCTHKQIYPDGFICVGEAAPYQPPKPEEIPSIPEIPREEWNLIDSIEINRYVEPGKNLSIYFDNEFDSLKIYPTYYENPLTDASYQALEKSPQWLRNDLRNVFLRMYNICQDLWANAIITTEDPYIDEVVFSIAHSSPEYLLSGYGSPDLLKENAELIYENDQYLNYVEVVDYGTSTTDENYYSTIKYWKENETGDTVQVEVPKEIYYWYIVHPKITDEIPAYIDPDIIENNTTHNNNIADPPDGVFWRNYLFNYADAGYPILKDMLENCEIVWNGVQNVDPSQTHASAVVTNWINDCMEFTSNYERPHQPVRILRKHIGRCGEHADLTAAAAKAALIPCTSILAISHDHTWNEFWEQRWVSWEPVNNMLDTPLTYENGWGWSFGSVFEIRSDGWLSSVTDTYSEGSATITIYALDSQGNPIDGAEIMLAVQSGEYIYYDNYGLTDNEGKFCFTVGEGRHYYARVDTDIGSYPVEPNYVVSIVNYAVNGQNYTYSLSVSGTMPSLDWLSVDVPEDDVDDYRLEIDFTVPSQIVSGRILMDDVNDFSQLYKSESDGIIDYFMTDEMNFIWYMVDMPFECFNLFADTQEETVSFDIPSDNDWYCVFANNRHLNNLQNVYGSAELYAYEEIGIDEQENEQTSLSLLQNFPNPFDVSKAEYTTISYSLLKPSDVEISIYNIKGQIVKTFRIPNSESRIPNIVWDGKDENGKYLPDGLYFYKLKADKYTSTKKMILMR